MSTVKFIEAVWWYPPSPFTTDPNHILASYSIDQYGMLNMQHTGSILTSGPGGASSVGQFLDNAVTSFEELISGVPTENVIMTPQAFTSWYEANTSAIQASANSSVLQQIYQQLTSTKAETNAANQVSTAGLQWMPASQWYNSGNYQSGQLDNWQLYYDGLVGIGGTSTPELYVLYDPNATTIQFPNLPWYIYAAIIIAMAILILGYSLPAARTIQVTSTVGRGRRRKGSVDITEV